MGKTSINQIAIGYNYEHAYDLVRRDAVRQYVNDPYAGTINCTSGCREITIPEADGNSLLDQIGGEYYWALEELKDSGRYVKTLESLGGWDKMVAVNLGIHEFQLVQFSFEAMPNFNKYKKFHVSIYNQPMRCRGVDLDRAKETILGNKKYLDIVPHIWGVRDGTATELVLRTRIDVVDIARDIDALRTRINILDVVRDRDALKFGKDKFFKIWTTYAFWFCGWARV